MSYGLIMELIETAPSLSIPCVLKEANVERFPRYALRLRSAVLIPVTVLREAALIVP